MNIQNIQSLRAATFALCSAPWNFLKDKLGIPPAVQKPHLRVAYYLHRLHQHKSEPWRQMELWYFYEKFHMSAKTFDQLAEKLKHCDLSQPAGIMPEVKLASVLEYLACGSIRWVCSYYGIGDGNLFGRIVDVVCEAISSVLEGELPKWTRPNLLQISADIQKYCKFPNCVGLMGEKLIGTKEKGSGEGPDTIMMLAICKADYTFSYVHVVAYDSGMERSGDAVKEDFFKHTQLGMSIANGRLRAAPAYSRLRGKRVPYVLLADEWFSLERHVMTPYDGGQLTSEERIYNARFRSALSCIDKAFKGLETKWACLRYKTYTNCDRQMAVVMACTFLHNFLVEEKKTPATRLLAPPSKKARYESGCSGDESDPSKGPDDCLEFDAERIRDNFKEYFVRQERSRSPS